MKENIQSRSSAKSEQNNCERKIFLNVVYSANSRSPLSKGSFLFLLSMIFILLKEYLK